MKSHADEIYSGDGVDLEGDFGRMWHYAKGLEFALECIVKGMKLPNSDFTCPYCTNPKPHIHTEAEEAKTRQPSESLRIIEEEFHAKHGPGNPCGKPFCNRCYPDEVKQCFYQGVDNGST
jgi:hypothetical protein